jgi:cytochrome c peroxidase
MTMKRKHWIVLFSIFGLYACSRKVVDAFTGFQKPANFPAASYRFSTNEISREKFELGRKLFYETRLSRDNTISCGTCHIQEAGFTHHGHDISHGIEDRLGKRNSPPIMNMAWSKSFFWDGGVTHLDLQPVVPVTNPVEMDETLPAVLAKLRAHPEYPGLFKKAFGSAGIDTERLMKALSQFMVMAVSANSRYDKIIRKEGNAAFTAEELAGYQLVQQHCSNCHQEPLFTDDSFRNNGIGIGFNGDEGRYTVTLQENDKYKFKVPSLRNLGYTSPYMHDGRFLTLEAVLQHYASQVKETATLDPLLKQHSTPGIPLTRDEQQKIISFLKTLNDPDFVSDKRFAER